MSVSRLIENQKQPGRNSAPGPHLWTVDEYHRLGDKGFFGMPPHHVELLEGVIYDKYAPDGPAPRKWTRRDYYRMAKLGFFGEHPHVELIEGEIFDKVSPQATPHTTALFQTADALRDAFGTGFTVRSQSPLVISAGSEPEPDISVLIGANRKYRSRHPGPADVVLVVEIADSSLADDRRRKAMMYAAAGIPEYWIVNVREMQVEVNRLPEPNGGYADRTLHRTGDSVTPQHAPVASIAVDDLLP